MRVVIDTNVLVSALRSTQGASYQLISSIPSERWTPTLSVSLYTQYQDVLLRAGMVPGTITPDDILAFCRYLASISHLQEVFFLWRPHLSDPDDDMVLELAVAAQAEYIVTYNIVDFRGAGDFGVVAIKPADFLELIRRQP